MKKLVDDFTHHGEVIPGNIYYPVKVYENAKTDLELFNYYLSNREVVICCEDGSGFIFAGNENTRSNCYKHTDDTYIIIHGKFN